MTPVPAKKGPHVVVPAAIGIRVHSGWGALVAVSGTGKTLEIADRRRIEIIDARIPGAFQPYHFAQKLAIHAAEKHIAKCAAMAAGLALDGVREVSRVLRDQGCHLAGAAILLSSARALPELSRILAAHPMIHAAEGEFFRQAFREACLSLKIPVTGIRERELDEYSTAAFGKAAPQIKERLAVLGSTLGPPWTQDQKSAALAAAVLLTC